MRLMTLFLLLPLTQACWFYSKEKTLNKIKNIMHEHNMKEISKNNIQSSLQKLPAPIKWAVNTVGINTIFEDCDVNKDNIITTQEMQISDTCLTSCFKLCLVNGVL
jgi:hypothetical protein